MNYACLLWAEKEDLFFLSREFDRLRKKTKEPKLKTFYTMQRSRYSKELESRGFNWKSGCKL